MKIDYVVPYVDCSDPEWLAEYGKYKSLKAFESFQAYSVSVYYQFAY